MNTYISQETGEPVAIECRFCRKFDDKHVPAVALAGQWEGGDIDVEPHWVPVCAEHLAGWHMDHVSPPDGRGHDVDVPIPEESRLPVLPFEPSVEIVHGRDPDSACAHDVYVNGRRTDDAVIVDLDPGRGWTRADWDDFKASATTGGTPEFNAAVAAAFAGFDDNQYIEEDR